ncbi:hypothetical protein B0H14DRAFT_2630158 [Mycena olivaceomarginata]|nr:hypothetical protein B0H14DRAFT_2630158 [Mycena olivaceomarginata]
MSQHNPPSNAVAHYERVPRPFSNPSVNVQFDSWSRMERNRFFSSALIFLKNPRSSTLVHTIISDNAGNNAATQGLFNNHTSYDTRWTTRVACATHLLNLRLQSSPHLQIKMSTRVLGTPLQARQAFRLLINPPDFQTELCEGVALHVVSFGVLYTSSMLLSNVSEGVALHTYFGVDLWSRLKASESRVAATLHPPALVTVRNAVTREVWLAQTPAFKEEVLAAIKLEHQTALKAYSLAMAAEAPSTAEQYHVALNNAAYYLQPFTDAVHEQYGMNVCVMMCGPVPDRGGRIEVRSIHSGMSTGMVPRIWSDYDRAGFDVAQRSFIEFSHQCFSEADCRARSLNKNLEETSSASGHVGDTRLGEEAQNAAGAGSSSTAGAGSSSAAIATAVPSTAVEPAGTMLERVGFDDDDILFGRDGLDLPPVPFNFDDLNLFDPNLLTFDPKYGGDLEGTTYALPTLPPPPARLATHSLGTSRLATRSLCTARLATRSLATSRIVKHSLATSHLGTSHLVTTRGEAPTPPSRDQRGRERGAEGALAEGARGEGARGKGTDKGCADERGDPPENRPRENQDEGEGPADGNEEERVGAATWEGQDMTAWQAEMRGAFEAFTRARSWGGEEWEKCVVSLIALERAWNFPAKGLLSAPNRGPEERPKEVPDFMREARKWNKRVILQSEIGGREVEGSFAACWWAWWEGGQPRGRKQKDGTWAAPSEVAVGEWSDVVKMAGRNGLLLYTLAPFCGGGRLLLEKKRGSRCWASGRSPSSTWRVCLKGRKKQWVKGKVCCNGVLHPPDVLLIAVIFNRGEPPSAVKKAPAKRKRIDAALMASAEKENEGSVQKSSPCDSVAPGPSRDIRFTDCAGMYGREVKRVGGRKGGERGGGRFGSRGAVQQCGNEKPEKGSEHVWGGEIRGESSIEGRRGERLMANNQQQHDREPISRERGLCQVADKLGNKSIRTCSVVLGLTAAK